PVLYVPSYDTSLRPPKHPSFPTRRSSDLFSGTGSLPRASTQHGTLPFSNWYGAYHSRYSRTTSGRPSRSRPSEIIAPSRIQLREDRKSTRLNSSHVKNSYAVFGLIR